MRLNYIMKIESQLKRYRTISTNRLTSRILDGSYVSMYKGRSMNFDELREYEQGDDIRDIDFKASASFVSGQLAMYTSALYSHKGYAETAPDPSKIQICPTPVADGTNKLYTSCAPVGAVISAKTKNKLLKLPKLSVKILISSYKLFLSFSLFHEKTCSYSSNTITK